MKVNSTWVTMQEQMVEMPVSYPTVLLVPPVLLFPFQQGIKQRWLDFLLTMILITCGPQALCKLITFVFIYPP
jgi:hypothetical protein